MQTMQTMQRADLHSLSAGVEQPWSVSLQANYANYANYATPQIAQFTGFAFIHARERTCVNSPPTGDIGKTLHSLSGVQGGFLKVRLRGETVAKRLTPSGRRFAQFRRTGAR